MTLVLATVAAPKNVAGRPALPNPWDGVFPIDAVVADDGTLIPQAVLTAPAPYVSDAEIKAVRTLISQARKAAAAVGRSARVELIVHDKDEKGKPIKAVTAQIQAWDVPAIKRPRKPKDETAPVESAETAPVESAETPK